MNSDHLINRATSCRFRQSWIVAPILVAIASMTSAAVPDGVGTHDDLIRLFEEFQEWKIAQLVDAVPDYSVAAINRRRTELRLMQQRMQEMGVRRWSVPEQVDFLTVRAELDQQDFILQFTRPWSRDPVFYVAGLLKTAFTELPADGDDLEILQRRLRAIPATLTAARTNLTDVAADYADLAIRTLTTSDGVEDGPACTSGNAAGIAARYFGGDNSSQQFSSLAHRKPGRYE
jgi:hypothetical protein